MKVEQLHRNVHRFKGDYRKGQKFLLMSDIHWDNPHCDRNLLEKHLLHARDIGAKVLVNGDFFCLMQGKGDPRKSKSDIRPEHNNAKYLDSVVETAVEYWGKWKDVLAWVGYGNHETSIIKHQETDILRRFVDAHNLINKPEIPLQIGGYTSWLIFYHYNASTNHKTSFKMHVYHGSGGGGAVTKGTIQHQRKMADVDGADGVWMGHVHELYVMPQSKSALNTQLIPIIKTVWHFRTGTYKEEYGDGDRGWHVERGAPPKPLGCVELNLTSRTIKKDNKQRLFFDLKATILT